MGLRESLKKESAKVESKEKRNIQELIQALFQSRDIIHLAHLKTNSYAAHVALNDYYDSVLGFADELAETAQGCEGVLLNLSIPASTYQEPLTHLVGMKECLLSYRDKMEYEFQKNIIDEITALVAKTIYKLKFLK